MLLKGLAIILSVFIVGIAILIYGPLPSGLEEPFKVLINTARFSSAMNIVTRDVIAGIPVIVYLPKDTSITHPAIVYFHGGGFVIGSPDKSDIAVYSFAMETGAAAINVDYRLAPEHPFPAPIQDCIDVTRYILKHGLEYNIDVTRVGVAGDSAGGNLAAAVALALTKEKSGLPPLVFQVLHYPAMQAFDMRLPSYIDLNESSPILTQSLMSAFYAYYMGADTENIDHYTSVLNQNRHIPASLRKSKFGEFVNVKLLPVQYQRPKTPTQEVPSDHDSKVYEKIKDIVTNPLFSPLMEPDLTGLPPAFIHACEFDVLRDDGLLYARRLQDAGVKTELHYGKGGFHGDTVFTEGTFLVLQTGKKALSAKYNFVRNALRR